MVPQHLQAGRPGLDARPGHLEHGAHGNPHGPPVERISTSRGDQDSVNAERRSGPEHGAHVGVIDDVLKDDNTRMSLSGGTTQQGLWGHERWSVHRRQGPAMQMKSSHGLDDASLREVHRHTLRLSLLDQV